MNKKILVIAAHPDDEVLGCAGTIARSIAEGSEVYVAFMTDGVSSRSEVYNGATERLASAKKALELLGATLIHHHNFPDNKMDSVPLLDVIQCVENVVEKIQPEIIYTHYHGDLNVDHHITNQAVITACRPQPGCSIKEIYAFEIPSSTEWQVPGLHNFVPNVYIDVTSQINLKREALEIYSEEMRAVPHCRSIENVIRLNAYRGNSVGISYAEAFSLIRFIR